MDEACAAEQLSEKTVRRARRWRYALVVAVLGVVAALLAVSRPSATYEEYLRIEEGMTRQQVVGIIGMADYWHHLEGDRDVTSWVNKDGTYIRAVFDKNDVLVEVSWESGWDMQRQAE